MSLQRNFTNQSLDNFREGESEKEAFYNKDVQKLIELYSTENEEKSCMIERFNRTIKEKMFKYFSANNTRKYVDILDLLVNQFNN